MAVFSPSLAGAFLRADCGVPVKVDGLEKS
jgi:hypothetical protein